MAGPGPTAELEKRAVVSSFIFHFPNGPSHRPLVALFKRSGEVRTYRHHIAPISGSIDHKDKDALSAAWREISEETRLDLSTLKFWRTGVPFSFNDESVGREWTVNPFAFVLKTPAEGGRGESALQIDWEHEGWQWYDPDAVLKDEHLTGVPHLRESLRRVWFEGMANDAAGNVLSSGLERLQKDHESGARELTTIALGIFRELIMNIQGEIDSKWWESICMGAWHIVKNGRESMGAATLNAVLAILKEMEEGFDQTTGPEKTQSRMASIIDSYLERRRACAALAKDTFASYLQSNFIPDSNATRDKFTILTLSFSSTIRDNILDAYGLLDIEVLELRILESRPLFEGVNLTSSILSNFENKFQSEKARKLHINLYTDASAALASKDVDVVLLGADRISLSKGVSNKTGTLPMVLSAKYIAPTAQVVVLSDLEKVNGDSGIIDDDKHEENDIDEVINTWRNDGVKGAKLVENCFATQKVEFGRNSRVEVKNVYFEWVPLSLVDTFVSGEGILDDQRIREQSEQQGELANRYFKSLSIWY